MRFTTSPGATGVILDDITHAPLSSAQAAISTAHFTFTNTMADWRISEADRPEYYRNHSTAPSLSNALANVRVPVVQTGPDGHFVIPRQTHWGIYIVPMDVFPLTRTLVVRQDGYEPLIREFSSRDGADLGNITLQPVAK